MPGAGAGSLLGRNARQVSRDLDAFREENGSLTEGVPLEGGGSLRVLFTQRQLPREMMNQPGGDNPFYSLGVNVKHMANGTEFYHNGEVADGEGGGSYFLKTANGYTAVVIWEGSQDGAAYSDLFKRMKSTLTAGD